MEWFRAYYDICSDTKWFIVARKAKCPVGTVVAVWLAFLEASSQAENRGITSSFDPKTINALYGYADRACPRVLDALDAKGLVQNGHITNWEKRQPKREREDDSAARAK